MSWQGPAQGKVGSKLTLVLNARAVQTLGNLGLVVSYDPALLKAIEVVDGSLVSQGGSASKLSKDIESGGGQVALELTSTSEQGVKGTGTLATLTFEVLAAGDAQVSVERVSPSGPKGETINFTPPAGHDLSLAP